ncbi:MAG: hypothetical protein WD267_06505 [Balneolales bacterium]
MSAFDLWVYRAKQLEIVHATEFYPDFNGKIVYPISLIEENIKSKDFESIYHFGKKNIYIHNPKGEVNQEKFVDYLVQTYFDLRKTYRSYFINIASLREVVCYKMKISERKFEDLLNHAYKLNLNGTLKIKISLEVDKLPEETKAIYLKQEPVMVEGKYRNIIAIDITKNI